MVRFAFNAWISLHVIPGARSCHSFAVEPDRLALISVKLAEVITLSQYGTEASKHGPHISADVATQVNDPSSRVGAIKFGDDMLYTRLKAHEFRAFLERALWHNDAGENSILEVMQVALGLITPHVWGVRSLAILPCSARTLRRRANTKPLFLSLLQLWRQGQVTMMVAKTSKGKADRFISVNRLFGPGSAFESLTA